MRRLASLLTLLALAVPVPAGGLPAPAVEVGEPPLPPGALARLGSPRFRHAAPLRRVYWSSGGKRLATAGYGGIYVWDAASGKRLLRLPPEDTTDSDLLGFGARGELVVARCPHHQECESELFRLDAATGRVLGTLRPPHRRFDLLMPDGRRVVSYTAAGEVVVDDLAAGRELWRRRLAEDVYVRAAAPDGSRLALWPNRIGPVIDVVETETGRPVGRFLPRGEETPSYAPCGVAISPRGEYLLAMHSFHGEFTVWRAGRAWPHAAGRTMPRCEAAVFTPDGRQALFAGDGGLELWEVATWKRRAAFALDGAGGWSGIALSPDGRTLAVTGYHCGLQLWDVATGRRLPASADPAGDVRRLHFLADGRLLTDFSEDGWFAWDARTRAPTRLPDYPPGVAGGGWTADRSAYVAWAAGRVKVFDPAGRLLRALPTDGDVEWVETRPDAKRVLVRLAERLLVWEWAARKQYSLPMGKREWSSFAVTPDGRLLAVFDRTGTATKVSVRELASGRAVRTFETTMWVRAEAFSADGRLFLGYRHDPEETDDIAGDDYAGLYDGVTGKLIRRVAVAEPSHQFVCRFAPDGRAYAVGDAAGRLVVYDTASGKERRRFRHVGGVETLDFSPDGRILAAASGEAPVYLWDLGGP